MKGEEICVLTKNSPTEYECERVESVLKVRITTSDYIAIEYDYLGKFIRDLEVLHEHIMYHKGMNIQ
jgi:hypothetical protein